MKCVSHYISYGTGNIRKIITQSEPDGLGNNNVVDMQNLGTINWFRHLLLPELSIVLSEVVIPASRSLGCMDGAAHYITSPHLAYACVSSFLS